MNRIPPSRSDMALLQRVVRCAAGLFVFISFFVATSVGAAQQDDPSDIFLKAYLSAQQGEKLERQDRFKTALAKYRFAGSLIEELRKSHADWQPPVVEYRGRKISESILRLQERITRQTQLNASTSSLPEIPAAAPESDAWSEPGPEVVAPQRSETVSERSRDKAIKIATKNLHEKIAELQAALEKSRGDVEIARKETDVVDTRLKETNSKLERTQNDLDDVRKSEGRARDQLAQLQEIVNSERNADNERQQLRVEVTQLKEAVVAADQARVTAEKKRDNTQAEFAEANNHIIAVERERDDALSQLKSAKQSEEHFRSLLAENNVLQQRLVTAEEKVSKLSDGDPQTTGKLAELEHQVAQLQQRLSETENRNYYLAARAAELDVELEHADTELQAATVAQPNNKESSQLAKENQLLRNIVVRERQEEARRDEARNVVLAEVDRLKVRSDLLDKQIELLAQPVTKLSTEELALFREPVVVISKGNPGIFEASFIFEKKSMAGQGRATAMATAAPKGLSTEFQDLAHVARNIEQGKYRTAQKQFETVLANDPKNLEALPILGLFTFAADKCDLWNQR